MMRHTRFFLLLVLVTIAMFGCRKKSWDEFYGRPDNLEPPIYQILDARGNFKSFLAAVDKAGYKNTLGAAGYWTLFAPHDSAFAVYFKEKGISSVADLDSNACRQIVTYCLVYNAFKKERIGDFQSTTTIGWVPNQAFRRRTANYTGVYSTVNSATSQNIMAINSNRNNNGSLYYVDADNNNKYITYFVDNFMAAKSLNAADYNYFYPNTQYTGFNVLDAVVTEKDIAAENGVIHVVNRVITSLPSIDEYLGGKPEYSEFKKLFDKYLISYILNQGVSTKYNNINGTSLEVFTKVFNQNIAFSPNNENFLKQQDNDGQQNSYSIFVPTNDVLTEYINRVLLEHYTRLDDMPTQVIYDFVNAHLWQNAVWPSKFGSTYNFVSEEARFNPATNIVDKKILSNGIFYGTNIVQEANVFTSVYAKAYLDPKYSMMTSLLNLELKSQIANIHGKFTLFLISDDMFNELGYTRDATVSNTTADQWRYTPKPGSPIAAVTGSSARVRLQRIVNMCVVPERDLTNLVEEGTALTYGSEYIGFKNNTVYGPGNIDSNNAAKVVASKVAKNGTVYYIDRAIEFSEANIGKHLEAIGSAATSPYNSFYKYLAASTIWNATTKDITGIASGTFYTFLVPDNAAILKAVNDGLLPGTGTAPNKVPLFAPTTTADKEAVVRFIQYHILNRRMIGADGVSSGAVETMMKNDLGESTSVFVNNSPTGIKLQDMESRSANVISAPTYYMSNRAYIHLLDGYLKYVK